MVNVLRGKNYNLTGTWFMVRWIAEVFLVSLLNVAFENVDYPPLKTMPSRYFLPGNNAKESILAKILDNLAYFPSLYLMQEMVTIFHFQSWKNYIDINIFC